MKKEHPLILVFYLDKELMQNPKIIKPFAESVNQMLAIKEANALAFFLPTSGEERVECINPVMIKEADMEKINNIIEDIKTNFSIDIDMKLEKEEIELSEEENSNKKPCECGKNPDGNCKCD